MKTTIAIFLISILGMSQTNAAEITKSFLCVSPFHSIGTARHLVLHIGSSKKENFGIQSFEWTTLKKSNYFWVDDQVLETGIIRSFDELPFLNSSLTLSGGWIWGSVHNEKKTIFNDVFIQAERLLNMTEGVGWVQELQDQEQVENAEPDATFKLYKWACVLNQKK